MKQDRPTKKSDSRAEIEMPSIAWKRATCVVCGQTFDYLSARRPPTCNMGECRYKYHYGVEKNGWANHQPDLFGERR